MTWTPILLWLLFASAALGQDSLPQVRPYAANTSATFRFPTTTPQPPPAALDVSFDDATELEAGADFIDLADGLGRAVSGSPFTGRDLAGRTIRVPGTIVVLTLRTDASDPPGRSFGFRVTDVQAAPSDPPTIPAQTLPAARVNTVYRQQVEATGIPPFRWALLPPSTTPAGLQLTTEGLLVGIPSAAGTAQLDLIVRDATGAAATRVLTLAVKPEFGPRLARRVVLPPAADQVLVDLEVSGASVVPLREVLAVLAFDPSRFRFGATAKRSAAADAVLQFAGLVGAGAAANLLLGNLDRDGTLTSSSFVVTDGSSLEVSEIETMIFTSFARLETREGEAVFILPPTADPGFDQRIALGPAGGIEAPDFTADSSRPRSQRYRPFVTLDGRRSVDPRGRPLVRYDWRQVSGPRIVLSGAGTAVATFTPSEAGLYRFSLQVDNGELASVPVPVQVRVEPPGRGSPRALAAARVEASALDARDTEAPLVAQPGDVVRLDGTGSTDPDPGDRFALVYQWFPPAGIDLTPSTTAASPAFLAGTTGTFSFGLRVRDGSGLESDTSQVRVTVVPARRPPRLTARAVADDTGQGASDAGDRLLRSPPPALRVSLAAGVVTTVTLKADLSAAEAIGGTTGSVFEWRVARGPELELDNRFGSTAIGRPTTPGVYELEVSARPAEQAANPSATTTRTRVLLLVESAQRRLPRPVARVRRPGPSKSALRLAGEDSPGAAVAGELVELDGAASTAIGTSAAVRLYRWEQVAGPRVELSDPTAAVTTFTAPDLRDGRAAEVVFHLFVDDGSLRSEPAPVALQVAPPPARQVPLKLHRGLNLIGLTHEPLVLDEARKPVKLISAGDLADSLGARYVMRLDGREDGPASFAYHGRQGHAFAPDFTLEAARAYLLSTDLEGPLALVDGRAWSVQRRQVRLTRGLNAIALPGRAPAGFDARALAELTGAAFVARLRPAPARFEAYVPGLSPAAFAVEDGLGYLVSVPSTRRVSLPGE